MTRAFCGHCGADWSDTAPKCACREAAERVTTPSTALGTLERFATLVRLGLSPQQAADVASGRAQIGQA